MQPWKPLLAILPAGLLLGLVGGQASRPVMLIEEERPWPQSVREDARQTELWQPAYGASYNEAYSRGYSYRPDLDYDRYAWPDQTDRSAELLTAGYRHELADQTDEPDFDSAEVDLTQTRRTVAELAAAQAGRLSAESGSPVRESPGAVTTEVAAAGKKPFVLPPVPPPLVQGGDVTESAGADEADVE